MANYEIHTSIDPVSGTSWAFITVANKSSATLNGCVSANRIWVRVRAIGADNGAGPLERSGGENRAVKEEPPAKSTTNRKARAKSPGFFLMNVSLRFGCCQTITTLESNVPANRTSVPPPSHPDRKLCVLYAEDDDLDVFIFERAVEKSKYPVEVVRAKNGEEAMDYLKTKTDQLPNVIVTDLKMPRADGFDLLAWIYANPTTAKIPCIVLSSSNEPQDKARAEALGATAYHVKDSDAEVMANMIAQIYQLFFQDTQS